MDDDIERQLILPPRPQPARPLCTACGRPINPQTGECAGCSD
jgi:hypothetical protein